MLPIIRGKHVLFSLEIREKVLENNKNSGKTQAKLKYKTALSLVHSFPHQLFCFE